MVILPYGDDYNRMSPSMFKREVMRSGPQSEPRPSGSVCRHGLSPRSTRLFNGGEDLACFDGVAGRDEDSDYLAGHGGENRLQSFRAGGAGAMRPAARVAHFNLEAVPIDYHDQTGECFFDAGIVAQAIQQD